MARKPNYDYEKRRKEQERKAKKDAKRAEREQRREDQRNDGTEAVPGDDAGEQALADDAAGSSRSGVEPAAG